MLISPLSILSPLGGVGYSLPSLFTELIDGIPVSMIKRVRTIDGVEEYVVDLKLTDIGFAGVEDTDYEMIYDTPLLTPIQAEYLTVKAAMTTQPSDADAIIQNKWVYDLMPVWDKALVLNNLAGPDSQSSLINWKSPGTINPSLFWGAGPSHTTYKGFNPDQPNNLHVNTNCIPSVNGAGFLGRDDMTVIIGINTEAQRVGGYDFGCAVNTKDIMIDSRLNGLCTLQLNGVAVQSNSMHSKRYFVISRNSATQVEVYKNQLMKVRASNAVGLCDSNLWITGHADYGANNRMESFALIFKYLTEAEVQGVIKACDKYLKHYSTNVRAFQTTIDFNLAIEGHSFVSSWAGGNTATVEEIEAGVNAKFSHLFGVDGSSITDCTARAAALDATLVAETSTYKNMLNLFIGTNGVSDIAGTGTTYYNLLKTYIQNRVTAGWKGFVYTITPSTSGRGAQFEIERNIYNNLMRNDLALLSNVYVLDTDTIAESLNPANATYYSDTLHPTQALSVLFGNLFAAKVEEIYG